jgi:prepilin-type N-terminal cleavage/methylation domain-containing protein
MPKRAFSLVELLVVIGIITILIAILLPVLSTARNYALRVECASRLRQLLIADLNYAADNNGTLIPGTRDQNSDEECVWISHEAYNALHQYGGSDLLVECPSLANADVLPEDYTQAGNALGWVIDYDYLAGRSLMLAECGWQSPLTAHDASSLAVACDLNSWAITDGWTFVAHPKTLNSVFSYDGGETPTQFGSAGGNVAYLNGSVIWTPLSEMTAHHTSPEYLQYYGMW